MVPRKSAGAGHPSFRWLSITVLLGAGYSLAAQAGGEVTNCRQYDGGPNSLAAALLGGGTVVFKCSGTIVVPEIAIVADTTIDGSGRQVVLSGNRANRVLYVAPSVKLRLDRITVSDGEAVSDIRDGHGGGILVDDGGELALDNAVVSGNHADFNGGGIHMSVRNTLTLANTTVSGNSASAGGGMYIGPVNTVTATDARLVGNTANTGAAIFSGNSDVELVRTTVSDNRAIGSGGGIQQVFETLTLIDSTVSGNSSGTVGGGIYNSGVDLAIMNGTISGNSAGNAGGGLFSSGDSAMLTGATFSGNTAPEGGAIWYGGTVVTLRSSILADSSGGNCFLGPVGDSSLVPAGENLVDDDSCDGIPATPGTGPGGINLGPLADNGGPTRTHALPVDSVAVDAVPLGDCSLPDGTPLETDQRGVTRPQGDACDAGAFELKVGFEPPPECDLDGNGGFDRQDIVTFASACRTGKATWLCDYTGDGRFNVRDTVLFVKACQGGGDQEAAALADQAMN